VIQDFIKTLFMMELRLLKALCLHLWQPIDTQTFIPEEITETPKPEVVQVTWFIKWIPIVANNYDVQWDQAYALTLQHSYMRLADIYLMYAEAAAIGYGS
jgi:hypothetical protein